MCTTYKSNDHFQLENVVCYKPKNVEPSVDEYTKKDFLRLTKGDVELAEALFSICTWEFPETMLDQWSMESLDDSGLTKKQYKLLFGEIC